MGRWGEPSSRGDAGDSKTFGMLRNLDMLIWNGLDVIDN
jgi:hypothetical protein